MGIRRMFHGDVVESDAFLEMPPAVQALYFHLGMEADEDGLVNCARQVMRRLGLGEDALAILIRENFVFWADDILVICHFRQANVLKNDRLKPPRYPKISKKIFIDREKVYSLTKTIGAVSLYTFKRRLIREVGIQMDSQNRTKHNKTKQNKTKPNITERVCCPAFGADPPAREENVLKKMGGLLGQGVLLLTDAQMDDLLDKLGIDGFHHYTKRLSDFILSKGATVNNHYATILQWWKEDTQCKL